MAKNNAVQFYLPPGRIVMGDTSTLQTKDQQGRDREHPTIFFGVAVPKTDPRVDAILGTINQVAWTHYQNMPAIKAQLQQGLNAPNFAWKVDDGDSDKNKDREGFAGCWIFRFATSIHPIKCGDSKDQPIDPSMIKCGYYVDVVGSVAPNGLVDKNAGVYLNPNGVRLLGYGKEIQSGPSLGQLFAQQAATLPPGASALPVADRPATMGAAPAATTPAPLGAPGPIGGAPAAAAAPGGPGFALGAAAPAAPAAPMPTAPIPAPAAPVQTTESIDAESAAIAAAAGQQHYPGYRLNAARTGYDPNPTPAVTAAAPAASSPMGQPLGGPVAAAGSPLGAAAPGVPAGAVPGQAALGAPGIGQPGSPIASPTSVPPSGVQPHPGFLTPPATVAPVARTAADIDAESAQIAAQAGQQHYPGYRLNAARTGYDANPTA